MALQVSSMVKLQDDISEEHFTCLTAAQSQKWGEVSCINDKVGGQWFLPDVSSRTNVWFCLTSFETYYLRFKSFQVLTSYVFSWSANQHSPILPPTVDTTPVFWCFTSSSMWYPKDNLVSLSLSLASLTVQLLGWHLLPVWVFSHWELSWQQHPSFEHPQRVFQTQGQV